MTTKIQVAFQGGGAKLIPLLAVAKALQIAEQSHLIEVTRAAGTSAGAIAACVLATREDIDYVQQHLKDSAEYYRRILTNPIAPHAALWRVFRGIPILNEKDIREAIHRLFAIFKSKRFIELSDLKIPVIVAATELVNERMKLFGVGHEDTPIVDALFHSCGLPFFVKAPKNISIPAYVDGGICANFPSAQLTETAKYGHVLGVGFAKNHVPQRITSVSSFALRLLDTAINNSVETARLSLGDDRIFLIDTRLETFDFDRALSHAVLVDEYNRVYLEAEKWLQRTVPSLTNSSTVISYGNPAASPTYARRLLKVFHAQHARTPFKIIRSAIVATAYSLLPPWDKRRSIPDDLTKLREFEIGYEPLYCMKVHARYDGVPEQNESVTWRLRDRDGPAKVIVLPVLDEAVASVPQAVRDVLVFFDPPLLPQTPPNRYLLTQQDLVTDNMIGLKNAGRDYLWLSVPDYWHVDSTDEYVCDRIDLVLAVPTDFPPIAMDVRSASDDGLHLRTVAGREMSSAELNEYGSPPSGFRFLGWTALKLQPDDYVGVNFTTVSK